MQVITDIIILTTVDEASEILRYIIRSTDNGHKLKRTVVNPAVRFRISVLYSVNRYADLFRMSDFRLLSFLHFAGQLSERGEQFNLCLVQSEK